MRPKSLEIYQKACTYLPGGVNSPVRSFQGLDLAPIIVASGQGSQILDADGHSYIDYCASFGPLILGHAHPDVVRAASQQMALGSSFGAMTQIEGEMAQEVISLIPSIEKIRFVSSGTEATMTALRLAKGFTGRSKIVKFIGHYHGHADLLLVQAGSGALQLNSSATSKGVSPSTIHDTLCLPFNDAEAVLSLFRDPARASEVAAVIVEPIAGNMGVVPPEPGFLELLREVTQKVGALLIFDEVITGFRVGLQGAQGLYQIEPDLTCLGKIVGGGFPAAAVGGKGEILDHLAPLGEVYQAGTLSGNPVAMRAGVTTLQLIQRKGFYQELEERTNFLLDPIREELKTRAGLGVVQQVGSMFSLFFKKGKVRQKEVLDEALFGELFRYLFARGIYLSPGAYEASFVGAAHTEEELRFTSATIVSFLRSISG